MAFQEKVREKGLVRDIADSFLDFSRLNFKMIFYLLGFLMFFCAEFFFTPAYVMSMRIAVIGYILLVSAFSFDTKNPAESLRDGDDIIKHFAKIVVWSVITYIVVLMVPFSKIIGADGIIMSFKNMFSIFVYWIVIVGFGETVTFAYKLPERIGIFWSSLFFALLHGSMILYVSQQSVSIEYFTLLIQNWKTFAELFVVNILFYFVLKSTNYNSSIVAIFHGFIDLKKLGVIHG